LAFSKKHKAELQVQYTKWLEQSQAVFAASFTSVTVKEIEALRSKAREAGGELHVVKNTLIGRSISEVGLPHNEIFEGTSLVGFAFNDPPALAKVLNEVATKQSDRYTLKGGFLGKDLISVSQVKALAELPALPVMRARLMGLLNTPATQLVRTLAEPARRMAYVIKAHSEQPQAA
jgi:large subunit ribosomal protein L10